MAWRFPIRSRKPSAACSSELKMNPEDLGAPFSRHLWQRAGQYTSRDSMQEFANLTLPPRAWAAAPIAPAQAEISRRKISSIFWKAWATTTGIDLEKLLDAAEFACRFSSRPYQGHLLRARRAGACGVATDRRNFGKQLTVGIKGAHPRIGRSLHKAAEEAARF